MTIELKAITHKEFLENKTQIEELIEKIWTNKASSDRLKNIFSKWFKEKKKDHYFYILQNNKPIGITGFYFINTDKGYFGLNHYGTNIKETGKKQL
jgi:benzoyl-CoA reductase/2-hydroxyglutaryl-CoA dehydratase subunit BcrC/BadD/HgdB